MAEFAHQRSDVGGDHRLVLDDQHVSGQLGVDVRLSLGDESLDLLEADAEYAPGLDDAEPLHGGEQEGLAGARRDAKQPFAGGVSLTDRGLELRAGRVPDSVEHTVEGGPGVEIAAQFDIPAGQCLQRRPDISVASHLVAGERPGVAPNERQVRRQLG